MLDHHAGLVHAAPPNHGTEPISLRPNVIYDYHETFEGAEEPSPNDEIARGGESLRASSRLHGLHARVGCGCRLLTGCLRFLSRAVCACSDPIDMWSGWSDELRSADEGAARL